MVGGDGHLRACRPRRGRPRSSPGRAARPAPGPAAVRGLRARPPASTRSSTSAPQSRLTPSGSCAWSTRAWMACSRGRKASPPPGPAPSPPPAPRPTKLLLLRQLELGLRLHRRAGSPPGGTGGCPPAGARCALGRAPSSARAARGSASSSESRTGGGAIHGSAFYQPPGAISILIIKIKIVGVRSVGRGGRGRASGTRGRHRS